MPRTLGLDVGDRRIGVAISDATRLLARPLSVIDRRTQDAIAALAAIARTHDVDQIVVGLPLHADGQRTEQALRIEAFAAALHAAIGLPVQFHDERHSTQAAREIIAAKKRKRRDEHDDAVAASVILQRHLDAVRPIDDLLDPSDFDAD